MSNVRIGEGPTTPRETADTPVSDVSLPPKGLGPPPYVRDGVVYNYPGLTDEQWEELFAQIDQVTGVTREVASRPSRPTSRTRRTGGEDRPRSFPPFSGRRGSRPGGRLKTPVLLGYLLSLSVGYTIAGAALMNGFQVALFEGLVLLTAIVWVRSQQ